MTVRTTLTGVEFDSMASRGAFADIPGKIELIDGEIRIMCPLGPVHCDYTDYLNQWSQKSCIDNSFRIRCQNTLPTSENDRPEPDIHWVDFRRYRTRHPRPDETHLLIEVADSSLAFDLGAKADKYAAAGIREYWVVDTRAKLIHVMTQIVDGAYSDRRVVRSGEPLSPACKPEAMLDTADLFSDGE